MIHTERIDGVLKFRLARSFLGRALYATTAYLIDGMLVDTGCAYTVQELVSSLKRHQVRVIVNTHSHEDHIAGNAALQKAYGVDILAHPLAIPLLANPKSGTPLRPYQHLLWGTPEPSRGKPIGQFVETEHHRFEVIHTPGHSPDHVCLYEPKEAWLFSGDLFVGGRDRALRVDNNIWLTIASLRKVAALDTGMLFPSSGSVRLSPRDKIIRKIDYLEELGERVLTLHREGLSYTQIRRALLGPETPLAYLTLGHFSGRNLIRSYIEDGPQGN